MTGVSLNRAFIKKLRQKLLNYLFQSTEMKTIPLVLFFAATVLQLSTSQTYYKPDDEAVLLLGGLFPVHANNGSGSCGKIQDYGLQRLEAMVLAVNMINNDTKLLPGLRLGFDIRDTCSQPDTALQASLDFIVGLDSSSNNDQESINKTMVTPGISGVVGSASSSESISAASLLRLFQTPQISYASTARILSDKSRYEYFFRTLPPDEFQAKVMVELLVHYNWTYVIAINSDDVYGQDGIDAFVDDLRSISESHNDTCKSFCTVGNPISIPLTASDEYYDNVIMQINQPWIINSSIIVLFGQPATAEGILKAINRYEGHRPMTLLVSDGAGDNLPFEYYPLAYGMISVVPQYRESNEFNNYFTSLKPSSNANPWFTEYWESIFSCSFNASPNSNGYCNESIQSLSNNNYQQNSKVPFVLDAVYAFAHAIHNMLDNVCGNFSVCDTVRVERHGRFIINGKMLLQYLHNVSFDGFSTNRIDFDRNGDQAGGYWINNLQKQAGNFAFVTLANWERDAYLKTSMNLESVQWGSNNRSEPVSMCSYSCAEGHYPLIIDDQSSCCWTCKICRGEREVGDGFGCFECPLGFSPNNNKSSCQENPLNYLKWKDAVAIIILLFTIFGLLCTLSIVIVFILYYKHTIIKASSRELTAIILVGLCLCFLIPFFSIGKPTAPTCGISRFLFGFAFSLCSAALLVKTNRIHRIFNRDVNSSQRPALISSKVQVLFTAMLVSVQVMIGAAWLIVEIPGIEYKYNDETTELTCSSTPFIWILVSLGYNLLLLVITAYFAFRTRKIPQNFNETKFINLTLYSVIIIWLAFIPVYITISTVDASNTSQSASQLFAVVLSAFTTLCSLFFPKIYFLMSARRKECELIVLIIIVMEIKFCFFRSLFKP